MPDNNDNVVNPNTNSPQTQPSAVQTLLAGLNQPLPQAPVYQSPIQRNTSKWAGLVQGALLGLAGGLKAGLQNVMDAGTPVGPHANGLAEGEAEVQNFRAQQLQQAQQQFQNQLESQRFAQEAMLNRARQMEANLNAYKLAQEIDNAPAEMQQQYLQGQQKLAQSYADDEHLKPMADAVGLSGLLQWMKQNGKTAADFKTTHSRDDFGNDIITIWPRHEEELDSATINKQLKAIGSDRTVPPGTKMAAHDVQALLAQEGGKVADNLRQMRLQQQREQFEHGENVYKEQQENARNNARIAAAGSSSPDWDKQVETAVDQIHNGKLTFAQATKGMGKEAAAFARAINYRFAQKYPNDNIEALQAYARMAENPQYQQQINTARTLFGSNGKPGTLDTFEDALNKIPKAAVPILSKLGQHTAYELGSPEMAAVKRIAPDIASELSTFIVGIGGRQSDKRLENAEQQVSMAETPEQIRQGLATLRQIAQERLEGTTAQNPFAREMAKDINSPVRNLQPSTSAAPRIMKNPKTGQYLISHDGGKTWQTL